MIFNISINQHSRFSPEVDKPIQSFQKEYSTESGCKFKYNYYISKQYLK